MLAVFRDDDINAVYRKYSNGRTQRTTVWLFILRDDPSIVSSLYLNLLVAGT